MLSPDARYGWGAASGCAVLLGCLSGWWFTRTPELTVPPRSPLPAVVRFSDGKKSIRIPAEKLGLDPQKRHLDLEKAARGIKKLSGQVNHPGKSARLRFTSAGLVATQSRNTRKMDLESTLRKLITYTNSAYPAPSIELDVEEKRPRI
ncbi:MAG: hypothetical protein KY468_20230, partial [Armatimonadetes bacterium]|nr:hypothetical protein [Armatimonadota bacterium]